MFIRNTNSARSRSALFLDRTKRVQVNTIITYNSIAITREICTCHFKVILLQTKLSEKNNSFNFEHNSESVLTVSTYVLCPELKNDHVRDQ